jgi:hypothetical protein
VHLHGTIETGCKSPHVRHLHYEARKAPMRL